MQAHKVDTLYILKVLTYLSQQGYSCTTTDSDKSNGSCLGKITHKRT